MGAYGANFYLEKNLVFWFVTNCESDAWQYWLCGNHAGHQLAMIGLKKT